MRLHALVIVIAVGVSGASAARDCFIDPSTGIRACCMNCDDTPLPRNERTENGSSESRLPDAPQEASPPAALREISHGKKSEAALLRRLVVRAELLPVGPAAMPARVLAIPAGQARFDEDVSPAVELRVPTGYTPPSSIPLENLRRAAAIVRAIPAQSMLSCRNPYDPCNEDTRFLGQQAGKALEGRPDEPLQVVVPDLRAADVAARRKEADAWIAQAVGAGKRLDELQTRRDAIERRLAPLKREYDAGRAPRGAEQETLEKEYLGLVEQERKTQGELGQAQERVVEILVEQ